MQIGENDLLKSRKKSHKTNRRWENSFKIDCWKKKALKALKIMRSLPWNCHQAWDKFLERVWTAEMSQGQVEVQLYKIFNTDAKSVPGLLAAQRLKYQKNSCQVKIYNKNKLKLTDCSIIYLFRRLWWIW